MHRSVVKIGSSLLLLLCCLSIIPARASAQEARPKLITNRHVLLLSIDGLHEQDLDWYVQQYPGSALASLFHTGISYTHTSTPEPSDSFPGLLALTTGGTPRSTGVYYDDTYDHRLSPPGSNCSTQGTEVDYTQDIDNDPNAIDGGGINPAKLPLDPDNGCTPVYPHSYLHVNTIFEVAHEAGLRTAWADKHLAYDLLNGPSGQGVDDLYTPEISANGDIAENDVSATEQNDDLKVQAILHEIAGTDHTGNTYVGVPAIFGMNFQAVNIAQKLSSGGYMNDEEPGPELLDALQHTDASIGDMLTSLLVHNLLLSTTVIVTAKHGQSPIDSSQRQVVSSKLLPNLVNSVQPGLLGLATQDDVALLWLTNHNQTARVVARLQANAQQAGIQQILSGAALRRMFGARDSRIPDIVVIPTLGVIYTKTTATKIAEHGGFSSEDTGVPLLVSNPLLLQRQIDTAVQTTQVAPTILHLLGLAPSALQAVREEQTRLLPNL